MTITRENVQPGDIVEAWRASWTVGQKVVGPVVAQGNALVVGDFIVGWLDGAELDTDKTVTVVSRAPRPLYVNHPRTEPVAGDIARDEDGDLWTLVDKSAYGQLRAWHWSTEARKWMHNNPERVAGATLLVDGETGEVVR